MGHLGDLVAEPLPRGAGSRGYLLVLEPVAGSHLHHLHSLRVPPARRRRGAHLARREESAEPPAPLCSPIPTPPRSLSAVPVPPLPHGPQRSRPARQQPPRRRHLRPRSRDRTHPRHVTRRGRGRGGGHMTAASRGTGTALSPRRRRPLRAFIAVRSRPVPVPRRRPAARSPCRTAASFPAAAAALPGCAPAAHLYRGFAAGRRAE